MDTSSEYDDTQQLGPSVERDPSKVQFEFKKIGELGQCLRFDDLGFKHIWLTTYCGFSPQNKLFWQVDNLFIFVPALVSIMMRFVTALDNCLGLNYRQLGDWILTIENEK